MRAQSPQHLQAQILHVTTLRQVISFVGPGQGANAVHPF